MSVTTKIAAALLAMFLALLGGAWIVLERAVRPSFERIEAADHARDRTRVEANLDALARDLNSRVLDYARWDATYAFLSGRDRTYPSVNFKPDWFGNYGVDLVVFADDAGRLLWSRGPDGADTAIAVAMIAESRPALHGMRPATGVMWTPSGPFVFAATRSTGSENNFRPLGYVIMARRLSESALRQQAQLDLALAPLQTQGELGQRFSSLALGEAQTWSDRNSIRSLIPLRAPDGHLVGAIAAHRERDVVKAGERTIYTALALFAIVAALALAALWGLLQRLVIVRLQRLERHLDNQSHATDLAPLKSEGPADEIGRLTDAYNELALRLGESHAREHHANVEREAAATANRMKSDFLANISYELRTPLNAVIGYSELIEEELVDHGFKQANADLRRITGATRHLLALINEILDLSKIEAGRLAVTPETFDVGEMVESAVAAISPLAQSKKVAFDLDLPNLGAAYSDQQRLRQCLVNVLTSACNGAAGGALSLTAYRLPARQGEVLRFEIASNGAGFGPEQLAHAFHPFGNGDANMARGLGLAVTSRLIRLLGGRIETTNADARLLFVLTVPVVLDDATAAKPANLNTFTAA